MLWTSLFNIDTQALSVHHYSRHIYIYLETKKGLSILKYLLYNNWLINFVIPSSLRWVRNVHNLIFSGKKVGFFFPLQKYGGHATCPCALRTSHYAVCDWPGILFVKSETIINLFNHSPVMLLVNDREASI